jgi:anti-anti-sigma regulatory factor
MLAQRIVLSGDIDIYTASRACRALDTIDGPAVVDLSEVRLLTAAGLTELARVAERVGYRVVALVGAPRHVRLVLAMASFDRLFVIEDGEGEA